MGLQVINSDSWQLERASPHLFVCPPPPLQLQLTAALCAARLSYYAAAQTCLYFRTASYPGSMTPPPAAPDLESKHFL